METAEHLLISFATENSFNLLDSKELTSLIDEISLKLQKLDSSTRYELLNSLYYNTKSNGYSSLLHLCFSRMTTNNTLKYGLWRTVYIFCELGLNPMNCNYLPPNQIILKHSMKHSMKHLLEIQEENEMKDMKTRILRLRSRESKESQSMQSVASSISSIEFNIGDINDVFGDNDTINIINEEIEEHITSESTNTHNITKQEQEQEQEEEEEEEENKRMSPFHSKIAIQPHSWTDLQLNDSDEVTTRNIIEVLRYCSNYEYNNYESPAIFTIYVNLISCCTILGNAFISLKQFNPKTLKYALCKLTHSKYLSVVDGVSYYDHLKMNKYEVNMKQSINNLKHNINTSYKRSSSRRFSNYLCYLYLIKEFYNKFRNESYQRFMNIYNKQNDIILNDEIFNTIKMYTFEDMSYCDTLNIGDNIENKWICIWFGSLCKYNHKHLNDNIYNKDWIDWICKNILKKLSNESKQYLSVYLTERGERLIKNCNNYQLKCNMIDILEKKLKCNNFDERDIINYINPKWFINNVILIDTLLIQKLLICCVNHSNYKDLCVYTLWSLLTNSLFFVETSFFDEIIKIIKRFSNNNIYFINGCCQNVIDSIFTIRSISIENNIYIQKNITTFLINIADKNHIGELSVDINKGLMQCFTIIPENVVLLKILTTNPGLLDFKICNDRGIINLIISRMQYIQNDTMRNIFYSWYQQNNQLNHQQNQTNNSFSHNSNNSNHSGAHSSKSIDDEQCHIM